MANTETAALASAALTGTHMWVSNSRNWSVVVWLLIFLAVVMPFAFIGVEMFLRCDEQKMQGLGEPA